MTQDRALKLLVLGINVTVLVIGGALALIVQRALTRPAAVPLTRKG